MMKKGKKILSILLSMILVLGLVPADGAGFVLEKMGAWIEVQAAETVSASGTCGDNLTWELSEDGVLTISGTGEMDDWNGTWRSPWYNNRDQITEVCIESGVTSLGSDAFIACNNLVNVIIPEEVTSIGESAFQNCSSLTEITIPDKVVSIEDQTFYNCSNLLEVIVSGNLEFIGSGAFRNCGNLEEITIPGNEVFIGSDAFSECSSLVQAVFPNGVVSVAACAFEKCSNLEKIIAAEGIISIEDKAFYCCRSLKEITIAEGTTSIGSYAFYYCDSLTEIIIPESVASIEYNAFDHCSSLTEIVIPEKVTVIHDYTFWYCTSLKKITIPESIELIGVAAFYGCFNLEEIIIPQNVTSVGEYAFTGCSSITGISIPEGITVIRKATFSGCQNLKEIVIPDGVTSIGQYAFDSCGNLKEIVIPNSVTVIDYMAFGSCSSLTDVYYKGSEDEWNNIDINKNFNTWLLNATIHYGSSGSDKKSYSIQIDPDIEHGEVSAPSSGEEEERITVSVTPEEGYMLQQLTVTTEDGEIIEAAAQDEDTYTFTMPAANVTISAEFSLSIRDLQCSSSAAVEVGDTGVLSSKVFEDSSEDLKKLTGEIQWTSSDPSVVEIGKVGYFTTTQPVKYTMGNVKVDVWNAIGVTNFTGVSPGTATITGRADGVSVTCEVTVTEPEDMESSEGGSLTLGEDISGSAGSGSGVSQFFPADWSLKHSVFPVEIIVTEDKEEGTYKIRGTIGIGKSDWLNDDAKWNKYKQNVEDASKYSGRVDCLDSFRKAWGVKSVTAVSTEKFNVLPKVSVMGYFENVYDLNMNPISTTGKLAADAKWEGSIDWQFVTPIGPFYLTLKGGGELSGNIGPEYDYNTKTVNVVDGELTLTPSVKVEGGYGIYKVATLGANGKLSAPITLVPATKGEWEASASLHIEVVFLLDFEQELLASSGTLWDTTGSSKARTRAAANGGIQLSEGTLSEIDTSSLNDVSAWNTGGGSSLRARAVQNSVDSETTVLGNVLGGSLPMQAEINGKRVMVFQSYINGRETLDSSILMYSVYENGAWSEPQAVWDTGTADLYADMQVVNGQLVLVWQKERDNITGDVENDSEAVLDAYAQNSEICFAVFDEASNTFTDASYVTENDAYDMMPEICHDSDDEIVISWVRNDAADLMQETGANSIYTAKWNGGSFEKEEELLTTNGTVDDYVIYENDGQLQTVFVSQSDGLTAVLDTKGQSIDALSDLVMFSEDGSISSLDYVDGKIVCVSGGTLYSYDPSGGTSETYLAGESSFGSEIQYVSGGGKSGYVWSLYDEESGTGSIVASMRTEDGYSEPVTLYEKEGVIWRYISAILDEEGNWQFVANAEDTGADSHSLISIGKAPETGITLAGASVDEKDVVDGKTGVDYFLRNTGDTTINELEITITLENGEQITEKVPVTILPGEDVAGTAYVDLSGVDSKQNIQISVVGAGQTDVSDCTAEDTVGLPDISVTGTCAENGDDVIVTALLSNESSADTEVSLSLFGDETMETELTKSDLLTVKAGSSENVFLSVKKNAIQYNENDAAYLTLKANVAGGDFDEDNNTVYIALYKEIPDDNPGGDTGDTTEQPPATETPGTGTQTPTTGAGGSISQSSDSGGSSSQTTSSANVSGSTLPPTGTTLTAGNASYIVTTAGSAVAYAKNLNTKATAVAVPSSVKIGGITYKVTSIADNAFKNNKKLKKVTIGSNVTSIGNSAFRNCTALKKVVIPAKVKQIGKKAFYNCKKLQSLTIKAKKLTAKTVGAKAFAKAGSSNYSKLKVKVPKKKYTAYVKMLKKKGLSARARVSK